MLLIIIIVILWVPTSVRASDLFEFQFLNIQLNLNIIIEY